MAEVTSTDEKDWGPEQTQMPALYTPFLLRYAPSYPPLDAKNMDRYRIISVAANGTDFKMEQWNATYNKWSPGYSWSMKDKPSFRVMRLDANSGLGKIQTTTSSKGCVCKRCNSLNRWAEPNQPDGKYLCFECRS